MTDRLRAMQRVLKVQTQLYRLAQWKLTGLERKEDALSDRQQHLLRFLDEEGSYTALFGEALMRRLRNVGEEKTKVLAAKQEQANQTLEESRRLGRMRNMVEDLGEEARIETDREDLRDILELLNHQRNASPR
jgi:signal transduction histidine kinase